MASDGTGANTSSERKKCYLQRPDEFTGKNYEEWMLSASLFMRASKRDIVDDEDKIMFVLSFMKQGLPAQFARNFNEDAESKHGGSFGTWADFKVKLQATFENKNRRKEALSKLKALKQGSQNAEAFFQQFELTQ